MAESVEELRLTGPFYCHNCEREIPSCTVDYTCPNCNGGFIEPSRTPISPTPPLFSALFGGDGDDDEDAEDDDDLASYDDDDDDHHHQHHRSGNPQGPISIAINHAPTTNNNPSRTSDHRTRISIHRLNNNTNPSDSNNNNFFNNFLQQFLNGLMGTNLRNNNTTTTATVTTQGHRNVNIPLLFNSNLNDFVWTRGGLDNIITMFMNQLDNMGPPPAGKDTIENLPTSTVTQQSVDENIQCHVCMEDFVLDEEVKQLPCKHIYHQDCITPWLQLHGTCPICRNPVEVNNTATATTTTTTDTTTTDNTTTDNTTTTTSTTTTNTTTTTYTTANTTTTTTTTNNNTTTTATTTNSTYFLPLFDVFTTSSSSSSSSSASVANAVNSGAPVDRAYYDQLNLD